MLILTRRQGERIFLGDNQEVCFTLISINGGTAKIGIDAPSDCSILREEVFVRNINKGKRDEDVLIEEYESYLIEPES